MADTNTISILIQAKDQASGALGDMTKNFESGMKKISVATGVVGAGLTAFAKSSTDYLTGLVKDSKALATQTGMTTVESSKLLAVMGRLGVDSDSASTSFKLFAKQIANARDNTVQNQLATESLKNKISATTIEINKTTAEIKRNGDANGELHNKVQSLNIQLAQYKDNLTKAANPLDAINVSTKNADGSNRSFNDILLSVSDRFKAMPDGAEKTAAALALFGRSGQQMVKVLNQGSDGIKELEKQADQLGLTLTSKNIGAVSDYIKSQKDLKDTTDATKIAVGSLTAPVLATFNKKLNETIQSLIGVHSPFRNVVADVLAFGGPVLGAVSALTGFLGNLSSAGPLLKAVGMLLVNPMFLLFAVAVAGIGTEVFKLHDQLGSWHAVLIQVEDRIGKVWTQISTYLTPKFEALWHTIQDSVIPAFSRIWHEIIEPLIPVLGTVFVGAIGFMIDALNLLLKVASPVFQFFLDHKWILLDLAGAFGALAGAMAFNAVFNALTVGFNVLTLVTIPSAMASLTVLKAYIASGAVFGPIVIVGAIIALQQVYDAAQRTKAAVDGALNAQAKAADQSGSIKDIEAKYKAGKISKTQETNAINALLKGVDSATASANHRAGGGPVVAGQPYIVGERGQEMFVPNQSGSIVPADKTAQTGGGVTNVLSGNFTFNTQESVDAFFNRLDKTQRLARMGMA